MLKPVVLFLAILSSSASVIAQHTPEEQRKHWDTGFWSNVPYATQWQDVAAFKEHVYFLGSTTELNSVSASKLVCFNPTTQEAESLDWLFSKYKLPSELRRIRIFDSTAYILTSGFSGSVQRTVVLTFALNDPSINDTLQFSETRPNDITVSAKYIGLLGESGLTIRRSDAIIHYDAADWLYELTMTREQTCFALSSEDSFYVAKTDGFTVDTIGRFERGANDYVFCAAELGPDSILVLGKHYEGSLSTINIGIVKNDSLMPLYGGLPDSGNVSIVANSFISVNGILYINLWEDHATGFDFYKTYELRGATLEDIQQYAPLSHNARVYPYEDKLLIVGDLSSVGDDRASFAGVYSEGKRTPIFEFSDLSMNGHVTSIEGYEGQVLIAGTFRHFGNRPIQGLALWDGTSWDAFPNSPKGSCFDLLVEGDTIYASIQTLSYANGGRFAIYRYDGSTWNKLGGEFFQVPRWTTMCDGGLYTLTNSTLFKLVDTGWCEKATFRDKVTAPGNVRDMISLGGHLFICGDFESISLGPDSFVNYHALAEYDPGLDRWSNLDPFGSSGSSEIYSLANWNNKLLVGGAFNSIGGKDIQSIAIYDNGWMSFSPMESYPSSESVLFITGLTVRDSQLFISSGYELEDPEKSVGLAKYDPRDNSWFPYYSVVAPNAIYISGKELYLGGGFSRINGVSTPYFAHWTQEASGVLDAPAVSNGISVLGKRIRVNFAGEITLVVKDILGRNIRQEGPVLRDPQFSEYDLLLPAPGVYFVRAVCGEHRSDIKLTAQ
jgi:hypothetical protein